MPQFNTPHPPVHQSLEALKGYGLDPYATRIFLHILWHHDETGAGCSEPIKTMANNCEMSINQASTALETLINYRLISKKQQLASSPSYHTNPPFEWAAIRFIDIPT